jgi:hypothetical protein
MRVLAMSHPPGQMKALRAALAADAVGTAAPQLDPRAGQQLPADQTARPSRSAPAGRRCPSSSCSGAGNRSPVSGPLVAGGWWLVAGGWWLVAGGWWLVAGGWWLVVAGGWVSTARGGQRALASCGEPDASALPTACPNKRAASRGTARGGLDRRSAMPKQHAPGSWAKTRVTRRWLPRASAHHQLPRQ